MRSFFTPGEVQRLCGISYRQLQYWDRTGFIPPSYRRRGKYRLYTFANLVLVDVATKVRKANVSIQRLRRIMRKVKDLLPRVQWPLSSTVFLIEGERPLVFSGEVLGVAQGPEAVLICADDLRKRVIAMFGEEEAEVPSQAAASA